jgi:glucose/mannose transport system substrate-binding protein
MISRRKGIAAALAVVFIASLSLAACGSDKKSTTPGTTPASTKFEFFSWWTGGGDSEGKVALLNLFKKKHPGVEVIDSAIAGGAGTNAQAELANRLLANDPPDSYQRHAGKELLDDISAAKVEDISSLYTQEGWRDVFPKSLLDLITVDGKLYSVPVNIHRSNVLWYNPAVLKEVGIAAPPKTWSEFLTQAKTIEAAGKVALTIGPTWTQEHLLENVLLGELGADAYSGLWDGTTDWKSTPVIDALKMYTQVLSHSNIKSAAADWQPAIDPIIEGDAAYNIMGDWADTYFRVAKKLKWETQYAATTAPGTEGIFNFLSDSFTLPVGAKHRDMALEWLKLSGSKEGQDTFNPVKGSIPARTDGDSSLYTGYLATPFKDWTATGTKIVGSLAHGVVADNAWKAEIDSALQEFVGKRDAAAFAAAVKKAYEETRK